MSTATALPKDDPRIIAWEQYKKSERYQNSKKWAAYPEHVDGSLWDAFLFGYESLTRQLEVAKKGLEGIRDNPEVRIDVDCTLLTVASFSKGVILGSRKASNLASETLAEMAKHE
jgi:hypothetical protein